MRRITPSPKIPCYCQDCTGALFHLPTPKPDRRPRETPVARYARYSPRRRTLCDDCIADIHARGQGVAPLPRPVRWRRTGADKTTQHLCDTHKEERQQRESKSDDQPDTDR